MHVQTESVTVSDASCTGEIKLRSLLNHLQDVAECAAFKIGGSTGHLVKRGYAWVILQYSVSIKKLPGMGESFRVKTRHAPGDGFHVLRVFEVESPSGEPLVQAKTSWILIDLAASRPVRALQHLPEIFQDGVEPIDPEFVTIPKLKESQETSEHVFPVRFHDLDANGHANNAVYFEWAYEATPLDLLGYGVREISASFRVSAKYGDLVSVQAQELEPLPDAPMSRRFTYRIGDAQKAPGKAVAWLFCVWEPLESPPSVFL